MMASRVATGVPWHRNHPRSIRQTGHYDTGDARQQVHEVGNRINFERAERQPVLVIERGRVVITTLRSKRRRLHDWSRAARVAIRIVEQAMTLLPARRCTVIRTFAVALLVLVASPLAAPFATFDLLPRGR